MIHQKLLVCALSLVLVSASTAAEPLLVGVADLAVRDDVAEALDLSEQQIESIYELIDRRELAGFESAMRLKDLPVDQRREQLKPFRLESQRQLAALLTDAQIAKLDELRVNENEPNYEPLLAESQPAEAEPTEPQTNETGSAPDDGSAGEEAGAMESDEPSTEPQEPDSPSGAEPASDSDADDTNADDSETDSEADAADESDEESDEESDDQRDSSSTSPPATAGPRASQSPAEPMKAEGEALPADEAPERPLPPSTSLPDDGKLLFNFRYQPWQDVLDWFAEQSDLSLLIESPPSGTFNYTDSKRYTPAEALDILNSVLLTKGYTLVRRERMLVLVNLEDGVPPNLVTDVPLSELDKRGEYELVRVLFKLRNMTPAVAAEEVQKLVGPQGSVVLLTRAGMIQVTETAGRVRAIREVIEAVEQPQVESGSVKPFKLEYILVDDALPVLRQMLGLEGDKLAADDGTLQLAVDSLTGRILASGTPEKIARLADVLKLVDVPEAANMANSVAEALQLEVYPTSGSDPESVLAVLQTLLAETPGVRIATDPATGNIVALATASDQATIRATIQQMQTDSRQIEAIPLYTVDPQLAVLAISKLFSIPGAEDKPDPRAPILDADLTTNTLLVRASPSQIDQIKSLLSKMGEDPTAEGAYATTQKGNVRTLSLSGASAITALEQVEKLWPMMRQNPIRVVVPSRGIQSYRPGDNSRKSAEPSVDFGFFEEFNEAMDQYLRDQPTAPAPEPQPSDPSAVARPAPAVDRSAARLKRLPAQWAAMQQPAAVAESAVDETKAARDMAELAEMAAANDEGEVRNRPGAPIVAAPGPGGTIIASEDLDALDALEQMLSITAGTSFGSTREYAVFYLKYAKAAATAETLSTMFGGGAAGGGGGGGLMGGIANAALGDLGGGLMGDLLGLGGTSSVTGFSAGSVDIVADTRLNLLLVYAQPQDIETVNQVLEILDQSEGPEEVEALGKPRLIPVYNTSAASIADVVRSVYSDRLEGGGGGGNQPSPQDILRALSRGQGGRGGGGADQEPEKMTIGVDERSNALVVRASDPLFGQVEALVRQLDEQQRDSSQSTQIISLKFSNSDAVKQALAGVFGADAIKSSGNSSSRPSSTEPSGGGGDDARRAAEETQRRIEMFRAMQQRMQQGGGGPPGGGRGGPPGGGEGGGRGGRGGRG